MSAERLIDTTEVGSQRRVASLNSSLVPWLDDKVEVTMLDTFGGRVVAGFETDPVLQDITERKIIGGNKKHNEQQRRLLLDVVRRSTHNSDYYVRQTGLFTQDGEVPPIDEVIYYDGTEYLGLHVITVGDMKGAQRIVISAFNENDREQASDRLTDLGYTYVSREN